jgi:putative flippase GtrA
MRSIDPAAPGAMPADRPLPAAAAVPGGTLARLLGKHQIASVLSTAVDFGTMTALVELAGLSAEVGTLLGALAGALVNFQLGRRWIFDAQRRAALPQAARYAVVSGASAALNALGEHLVHGRLGVQYLAARAIVAVTVSLCWNFPMQRRFVFRHGQGDA